MQGYKGDPERKIGIVGRLLEEEGEGAAAVFARIRREFGEEGELFLPSDRASQSPRSPPAAGAGADAAAGAEKGGVLTQPVGGAGDSQVRVLAVMNAFHAEEIQRVISLSVEAGWISPSSQGREILYLTGAPRPYGLEAAAANGMPAVCVGHLACEKWGLRWLAEQVRKEYSGLDVLEIYEEEEVSEDAREKGDELAERTEHSNRERGSSESAV